MRYPTSRFLPQISGHFFDHKTGQFLTLSRDVPFSSNRLEANGHKGYSTIPFCPVLSRFRAPIIVPRRPTPLLRGGDGGQWAMCFSTVNPIRFIFIG
jgi:hypothetical protein